MNLVYSGSVDHPLLLLFVLVSIFVVGKVEVDVEEVLVFHWLLSSSVASFALYKAKKNCRNRIRMHINTGNENIYSIILENISYLASIL